ncbi:MAG: glucuronate isomerase [Candidatus Hydrogenedentes bacterium]|nr:glucuronate isomerase [Candidatus Hydrogenedentota bacterium]
MCATVTRVCTETAVTDLHTHLFAPAFRELLLYGIDDLLTYHYLVAEYLRVSDAPYEQFWVLSKRAQADHIWQALFLDRSPISEACRGVLTVLDRLGLDVGGRDLDEYREYFAERDVASHVNQVFDCVNLKCIVMTNDPFDEKERPVWEGEYAADSRFHAALRVDVLLNSWGNACERLEGWGYDVEKSLKPRTISEVRRFLTDWLQRTRALYTAVSLPPDFAFPEDSARHKIITECVLPVARLENVPFAMMIGVKRAVNPALRLAGDGLARSDVGAVERLCAAYPENKFMVTMLSRENQHDLCVAARKFRNLLLFGCWWFLNNPSLIEEMTRMRIELLGLSIVPQHSDARVLEQVIYKWEHSRQIIAKVLADKYTDVVGTGWSVRDSEIKRDVGLLFGENFWNFLKRT